MPHDILYSREPFDWDGFLLLRHLSLIFPTHPSLQTLRDDPRLNTVEHNSVLQRHCHRVSRWLYFELLKLIHSRLSSPVRCSSRSPSGSFHSPMFRQFMFMNRVSKLSDHSSQREYPSFNCTVQLFASQPGQPESCLCAHIHLRASRFCSPELVPLNTFTSRPILAAGGHSYLSSYTYIEKVVSNQGTKCSRLIEHNFGIIGVLSSKFLTWNPCQMYLVHDI